MFSLTVRRLFFSAALMLVIVWPAGAIQDHSSFSSINECLDCHPRALPTHEMARPERMPEGLQVYDGKMICTTCHDCSIGICTLRKETPDLCQSCHDCTKGMGCLLGVAHLGNSQEADFRFSDCLSCHEGSMGKAVTDGGHKVDVYYMKNKDFNTMPDRAIILVDGKVTCISCHNPYKKEPGRLVMSNVRSRLCLSCHIK